MLPHLEAHISSHPTVVELASSKRHTRSSSILPMDPLQHLYCTSQHVQPVSAHYCVNPIWLMTYDNYSY